MSYCYEHRLKLKADHLCKYLMDYAMGDGSYYSENILNGILCALSSSFPFKATMLLLKLNLIHTVCLKRQYSHFLLF